VSRVIGWRGLTERHRSMSHSATTTSCC